MLKNEKNNVAVQAETVLETKLSFIEEAIEQELHTVEVNEEEQAIKEAMQALMAKKGLVACPVPVLFFTKEEGWRETIRQRLVALIECHKPGGSYNVKIHDLEFKEYKTVREGNKKIQVEVSKEAAIGKYVSLLMSDSKDKSEKQKDGSYLITPASSPADFTIKAPTTRKPVLQICFDMNK